MIPTTRRNSGPQGLSAGASAVLAQWFHAPGSSPSTRDPMGRYLEASGYRPSADLVYSSTAAFVADLVLSDIGHRLPGGLGGTCARSHSRLRDGFELHGSRGALHFLPRLLFRLNWATHGDNIRWPADYYATWLPGYHRWIVTASSDSRQLWGAYDVALGWFEDALPLRTGVRQTLLTDWRGELGSFSPFPWESVVSAGAIDHQTANRWRAEAWPDYAT